MYNNSLIDNIDAQSQKKLEIVAKMMNYKRQPKWQQTYGH